MTRHPLRQIKILAIWQLILGTALSAVAGAVGGGPAGASFAIGVLLGLGNLLALAWGWWRLLTEKPVAWTVVLIVIKYAVLLSSIFYFARTGWFETVPAGLGIASFVLPALGLAVFYRESESTGG